jgi:hypothetical protein
MFVALILVWGFENLPTNTCFYDVKRQSLCSRTCLNNLASIIEEL